MKAQLTGGQVLAAIFAGIFGNLLFSAGWTSFGVVLLGGVFALIFGGSISAIVGSFADPATIAPFFDSAGGLVSGVVLGFGIGSVIVMLLGFLVSGWILGGGKVRKPWRATLTAILISALLNVPVLIAVFAIANGTEGLSIGIILLLATAVLGILVWLWMAWAHRGYASEFVGASVTASATSTTPIEAAPVKAVSAEAEPAKKAPVKAPPTEKPSA